MDRSAPPLLAEPLPVTGVVGGRAVGRLAATAGAGLLVHALDPFAR